jgi:type I restriction enzyme S subunit
MGNVRRGYFFFEKLEFIQGCTPSENDRLNFGDFLFNTRNTLELVGKSAIWRGELPVAYFNSNLMRISFYKKYIASNFFANLLFNTQVAIQSFRGIAIGTTSVAAIYSRDLFDVEVILPELEEQLKIVEVLGDFDAEILKIDSRISKVRLLKQAMMQELLTGKTRLI